MSPLIFVGLGGMLGAITRYLAGEVTVYLFGVTRFPIATAIVNLVGCFAIGALVTTPQYNLTLSPHLRLFIVTGFLGGFTTFSAFGVETFALARGEFPILALLNIALQVLGGLFAVWLGMTLGHRVLAP